MHNALTPSVTNGLHSGACLVAIIAGAEATQTARQPDSQTPAYLGNFPQATVGTCRM